MTPEEQQAFVEVITGGLTEEEIAELEESVDYAQFEADVVKVRYQLAKAADFFAEATDVYVVAAALSLLSNEYNEATEGDTDEAE